MTASAAGVLGFFTKAPDILGFMSTHARDNPYFKEHVPSYMDGLEAARVLRDVRVMVGDVHKMEDVGHVAFASADVEATRISSNRLYD
jgi:DNA topoisomerase VI subunit B